MTGDLPPLAWLRAFEAAARTLSFTAAARELNVTQAAVSKHIKALEHRLGQPLFVRLPRSLALTRWGEAYQPKVRDGLDRIALGTREVFGRRAQGTLTLRCAAFFAAVWLAPRLPRFLSAHPQVRLRLLTSVWADPFDAAEFDLDIQYGSGQWTDVRGHRLTVERLTPLCAPAMAARLRRPEDLAGERLLHVLGYQDGWGSWLRAAGVHGVDPGQGLHADTSLVAQALAVAGAGVALGRSSLAVEDRARGRLVAPFALELPIDEGFFLLEPLGLPSHPDAPALAAWLRAEAVSGPTAGQT